MTGAWQDDLRRVIQMDQSEIELWQRIANTVSSQNCKKIIHMMIKKEREKKENLRMLIDMDDSYPAYDPGYDPGHGPGYRPDYGPGYGPGKKPCYDPPCDPMPYAEDDKNEK